MGFFETILEGSVDHIIYRDYTVNWRFFIYCSLATLPFLLPASITVGFHSQTAYLSFGAFSKSTIDPNVRAFWPRDWNVFDSGLFLYSSKVSPAVSYSVPSLIVLDGFCGRKTWPFLFFPVTLALPEWRIYITKLKTARSLLQKSVVGQKLARQKLTRQTHAGTIAHLKSVIADKRAPQTY